MQSLELITSAANPLLKEIRKAVARGGLTSSGYCVAEGFNLLEEALRSDVEIGSVVVAERAKNAALPLLGQLKDSRLLLVPDEAFAAIATTEAPQGITTLVRPPLCIADQIFGGKALVAILDGIQDPGNTGAIVRTAEAFGATGVVFLKGSANPHHPRTLRAAAGSLFRMPYLTLGTDEIIPLLQEYNCRTYAAVVSTAGAVHCTDASLSDPVALVIGSEGRGVSEALKSAALPITIQTQHVESLNASVAAAILLYEASRQRGFAAR